MSNFNLEKALNGQAFYLKNGYRGVIKYGVEDHITSSGRTPTYPYIGYILDDKGFIYKTAMCWNKDGKSNISPDYCATTMVEETSITQEKKPMKPFDLEEALQGKPVRLRNGMKAIIYYNVPKDFTLNDGSSILYPLKGITFTINGDVASSSEAWRRDGSYSDSNISHNQDIIGMWEEDISSLIQKALKENLPMKTKDGTKTFIVAILSTDDPNAEDYPVFTCSGKTTSCRYTKDGKFLTDGTTHSLDIVGLWTE